MSIDWVALTASARAAAEDGVQYAGDLLTGAIAPSPGALVGTTLGAAVVGVALAIVIKQRRLNRELAADRLAWERAEPAVRAPTMRIEPEAARPEPVTTMPRVERRSAEPARPAVPAPAVTEPAARASIEDRRRAALRMAGSGASAEAIARETRLGLDAVRVLVAQR